MNTQSLLGQTIILAEDDVFLADVIKRKLELYSATVLTYTNGTECLEAIKFMHPQLVLLDIQLPGLNGYEILQNLYQSKITPDLPVIVISNSGQAVEIEKILQLGIRDYIVKANFEPEEVLVKIFEALNLKFEKTDETIALTIDELQSISTMSDELVRVLVVEDDPLLRNMLSVKLSKSHCPYMFSNDGLQALELVEQFEPQVIVLDLMIPGKDGFTVLAELKADARFKAIPVVVFSNKSGDDEKAKALELGAHSFRMKALTDLNELVTELRKLAHTV